MTLEWVPGVCVAIAGSSLSFWRGAAVTDERVRQIKEELAKVEEQHHQFAIDIHDDFRETVEKLSGVVTEMKVLAAEQGAFNRICTKTLEGISNKQDQQELRLFQQHTDIELLKAEKA